MKCSNVDTGRHRAEHGYKTRTQGCRGRGRERDGKDAGRGDVALTDQVCNAPGKRGCLATTWPSENAERSVACEDHVPLLI